MLDNQPKDVVVQDERVTRQPSSVIGYLKSPDVMKRFRELLGDRADIFISNLVFIVSHSEKLRECEPASVVSSAIQADSLKLPIHPSFGFINFVPFKNRESGRWECTMIPGWKGYGQLALRTGQVRNVNAEIVREGEITGYNRFTGVVAFGEKKSETIVGYYAMIELTNGFRKEIYITVDEAQEHGRRYSTTYNRSKGEWFRGAKWNDAFEKHNMGKKTAFLKLKAYMPMSVEIQNALEMERVNFSAIGAQDEMVDGDEPEPLKQLTPEEIKAGKDALGI